MNKLMSKTKTLMLLFGVSFINTQDISSPYELATGKEPNLIQNCDFEELFNKTSPAVVDLLTEYNIFIEDPSFRFFFEQFDPQLLNPKKGALRSSGSAVIISPEGLLVTCDHVINKAHIINVTLSNNQTYKAKLIRSYPEIDLAFLKIESKEKLNLPFLKLGSIKKIKIGEPVAAIGNSFGLGQSLTTGVISTLNRKLFTSNNTCTPHLIQHSASVNPGNSGGALVDAFGNLIGINNAIMSRSGSSHGVSFAIPIEIVISYLKKIFKNGKQATLFKGIIRSLTYDEINSLKKQGNFLYKGGVVVLEPENKNDEKNILPFDIIVEVNNQITEDISSFKIQENLLEPLENTKVKIWRKNKLIELNIVTQEKK